MSLFRSFFIFLFSLFCLVSFLFSSSDDLPIFEEKGRFSFIPSSGENGSIANSFSRNSGIMLEIFADRIRFIHADNFPENPLELKLIGSSECPKIIFNKKRKEVLHFYQGEKTEENINSFGSVYLQNVFPGIDWEISLDQSTSKGFKYQFIVHPGADPSIIKLQYSGSKSIKKDKNGDLLVLSSFGEFREDAPFSYQIKSLDTLGLPSEFELESNSFSIKINSSYEKTLPLIIDPFITWSTYLGGDQAYDLPSRIRKDPFGNIWIVGTTNGVNFPTTPGAPQDSIAGNRDVFVSKFSPSNELLFSTYLGSPGEDIGYDIDFSSTGEAWLCGHTHAPGFPTTVNAWQPGFNGGTDFILVQLSQTGNILYSTLFGGSSDDEAISLEIDQNDDIWMTGLTRGTGVPTTPNAFQPIYGGGVFDAMLVKFSSSGQLLYSSFVGGAGKDNGIDLELGENGSIWLGGQTDDGTFPLIGPSAQTTHGGSDDLFLCQFDTTGSLQYSTLFGGSNKDLCAALILDHSGNIWVAGNSLSTDFPCTNDAFQNQFNNYSEITLTRFDSSGQLGYSSYYGKESADYATDLSIDLEGYMWVGGYVVGFDPFYNHGDAIQPDLLGFRNGIYFKTDSLGQMLYSSHFGGGYEEINSLCFSDSGDVYLTGYSKKDCSEKPGFPLFDPIAPSFFDPTLSGGQEGFISRIGEVSVPGNGNNCWRCNMSNSFELSDSSMCSGDSLEIISDFSGPDSFNWLWDSHTISTSDSFSLIFPSPGIHVLQLIASNGYCTDTITSSLPIQSFPLPPVSFSPNLAICDGAPLDIVLSPNSHSYFWDGGTLGNTLNITTSGSYGFYYSDTSGCSARDCVLVESSVTPFDFGEDRGFCDMEEVLLEIGGSFSSGQWQDGSVDSSFTVTESGTYWFSGTDSNGCFWTDTISLDKEEIPIELGQDTSLCIGDSLILSVPQSQNSISWSTGSTDSSITVFTSGLYHIEIANQNGCVGQDAINIAFHNPELTLGSDSTICVSPYILSAGTGFESYHWSTQETTEAIEIMNSGSYWCEITDSIGCSSYDTINLILSSSSIELGNNSQLCPGDTLILNAGSHWDEINWSNGTNSPVLEVTESVLISLSVTDSIGCEFSDSIDVLFFPETEVIIEEKNDSLFANQSYGLQWYYNSFPLPFENNFFIVPQIDGDYQVEFTDSNGCVFYSEPFTYLKNGEESTSLIEPITISSPFEEYLIIRFVNQESLPNNIKLFNLEGKQLLERSLVGNTILNWNLSSIAQGMYLIRIELKYGYISRKVIKL